MPSLIKDVPSVVLAQQAISPGNYTTPAWDVPAGVSRITASLLRNAWPDTGADVVKIDVEQSSDNGGTWTLITAFTSRGGIALDKLGAVLPKSWVRAPVVPGTQVRAKALVMTAIVTEVELLVS